MSETGHRRIFFINVDTLIDVVVGDVVDNERLPAEEGPTPAKVFKESMMNHHSVEGDVEMIGNRLSFQLHGDLTLTLMTEMIIDQR